tara:strand:+ start:13440 stop:14738 length:1299 start_codon:yes stop_codon:yes gene_type:complete
MSTVKNTADKVKDSVSSAGNAMRNMVNDVMSGNCYLIIIYLVCVIFIIIFTYSIYLKREFSKGKRNRKEMGKYASFQTTPLLALTDVDYDKEGDYGAGTRYALIDYHVKSSFNSCCSGPVINGTVSLEALNYVIRQGVRFLDFEIYLVKNEAVVAAGRGNVRLKDTLNELNISTVLKNIKDNAIKSSSLTNRNDPLILNFRIMSENENIYAILEKSIKKYIKPYLLSADFGYCGEVKAGNPKFNQTSNGKTIFSNNVLFQDFKNLKGKVIIFAKGPPNNPTSYKKHNSFYELMNGGVRDGRIWYKKNHDVTNSTKQDNQEGNKNHYCITYPDVLMKVNSNAKLHLEYGCQAIMMNFGAGFCSTQMKIYKKKFEAAEKAFVLKEPRSLRRIRKFGKTATPQDPRFDPLQKPCSIIVHGKKIDLGDVPGGCDDL